MFLKHTAFIQSMQHCLKHVPLFSFQKAVFIKNSMRKSIAVSLLIKHFQFVHQVYFSDDPI